MSRQLYRVPLDFDHPLKQVWPGYLMPEKLHANPCPVCADGFSAPAREMMNLWYGHSTLATFTPDTPWSHWEPIIMERAKRNVDDAPAYYGTGQGAILREAKRLADLWNCQWSHHLTQDDVDALVAGGRLMDFTHTWTKADGWVPKDPAPKVTAADVNLWSILGGLGHDSLNAHVVIQARCEREGVPYVCGVCKGSGTAEAYPGQDAERDAWKPTDPPTGPGYQLWEMTSEGSPITPVFDTPEALAAHIASTDYAYYRPERPISLEAATALVNDGWAPTGVSIGGAYTRAETAPLALKDATDD